MAMALQLITRWYAELSQETVKEREARSRNEATPYVIGWPA